MKNFIFLALLAVPSLAYSACEPIEYAQLKDMSLQQLENQYDYYSKSSLLYSKSSLEAIKAGSGKLYREYQSEVSRCSNELSKINQVISQKRQIQPSTKNGSDTERYNNRPASDSKIYRSVDKNGTMVFKDNP